MWNEEELRQLIAHGETTTVELKVAPPRPTELAERLCGMANAQGGTLIIGVEDGSLKIVGVQDARAAVDVALHATRLIHPLLVLDPPEPEMCSLEGTFLVVLGVPAHRGPLYQSGGVFWIRRSTHTVPLTLGEVFELANDRGLLRWELQPARKATMQDIDLKRVEAYFRQRSLLAPQGSRFEEAEKVLIGMDCATVSAHGGVFPTNAGLLFFGANPQRSLPHSEVVCMLFRDELGVGGYLDRKIVTGPLQTLVDETELFLQKSMTIGARIEGWKRIDLPEYPLEALREAVVNAVVHRDYSRDGESIRVFFYPNREYREITGAKDTTVLRDLEILLDRGVLKAVGKGRSRKYTLKFTITSSFISWMIATVCT